MAEHPEHSEHSDHIVSVWVYLAVFGALVVGTVLTWGVAHLDLGRWNLPVAVIIACAKASLVVLFFMHIFYSSRLTKAIFVAGLCTLIIMFFFTLVDLMSRGWLAVPGR